MINIFQQFFNKFFSFQKNRFQSLITSQPFIIIEIESLITGSNPESPIHYLNPLKSLILNWFRI